MSVKEKLKSFLYFLCFVAATLLYLLSFSAKKKYDAMQKNNEEKTKLKENNPNGAVVVSTNSED